MTLQEKLHATRPEDHNTSKMSICENFIPVKHQIQFFTGQTH